MAKKTKRKTRKQTIALIDDSGLLTGFATRHVAAGWRAGPREVAVPDGCDLAPGRYRWNAPGRRFEPLPPPAPPVSATPPPDALRAIWLGFRSLTAAGHELPPETKAWIAEYGKTIDAKGERR